MGAKKKRPSAVPGSVPRRTDLPGLASVRRKDAGHSRRTHLLAGLGLVALALLAYSNSFGNGFPLDSQMLIQGDPRIREATSDNVGLILQHTYWWPNGEAGIYRPLTTFSYLFNYAILGNGDHSAGYHWINFLLH